MLSSKMTGPPTWSVSGLVEAPPAKVSALLLRFDAGLVTPDSAPLVAATYQKLWGGRKVYIHGGPREYYASVGQENAEDVEIEVDRANGIVAMKGHWWYGGTHTVEPHASGTLVVHRAWNIASGMGRLAVPLVNRGFERQMRDGMKDLLRALGDRLHVKTKLNR